MADKLFIGIDNYEVYVTQVASIAEKETFNIAVRELVEAINVYTKKNAEIVANALINEGISSVTANKYVYFNLAASDASENIPSIYAILFKWYPFHSIEIVNADIIHVNMIGKCTDDVRWNDGSFYTAFYSGYQDGVTSESWNTKVSCTKGYFNNLDETLFNIFNDKYDKYCNFRSYLGLPCGKDHKGITDGTSIEKITNAFVNATNLLSEYPRGIDYKNLKLSSLDPKSIWYHDVLEKIFTALEKENKLDAAYFYAAMSDYAKEIEKAGKLPVAIIKEE